MIVLVSVLFGCATPTSNVGQKTGNDNSQHKEMPIPEQFKDRVDQAFAFGKVLKIYDDIAWLGTDAVTAAGFTFDKVKQQTYVVEPISNDLNGIYQFAVLGKSSDGLRVYAIAKIRHESGMGHLIGVKLIDPPVKPSDQDRWLYQAFFAAENAPGMKFCNAIYNHVVLPFYKNGSLEYRVYFLMSTNKVDEVPIGGHILVRVGGDAKTILEVKPLAKSCMIATGENQKRVVALEFSDLSLDSPSAAQVFLMYRYAKPVYVITKNGFLWAIDSRGIRLLSTAVGK
ncbi:MAG: hypothetical protein ACRETA_10585 [Gammaproteobacteria bacterium]